MHLNQFESIMYQIGQIIQLLINNDRIKYLKNQNKIVLLMDKKIFYLNYIICFIDDEYGIYHSLDETFCSKSILGIQSDSFHKVHGEIYQFIYEPNYCFVRAMKNPHHEIEEEPWMKYYIQENYRKIFLSQIESEKSDIFSDIRQSEEQKTFFVKKIEIKMKQKVFNKITHNSNSDQKEYDTNDLFFICYSYAFSFLDNQFIILKNIFNLIIRDKFDLNKLHDEFIQFVYDKYQDSKYFKQFTDELKKSKENDIQSKIDQFISDNHNYIHHDDFLNELFKWKTKLTNLFMSIQQAFCLHILNNENALIMKIKHNYESKCEFYITIENFESALFILSNNCMISCISLTMDIQLLFLKILNFQQDMNLNIDLSEFYIKLYGTHKDELIDNAAQLDNFLLFLLLQKADKIITIHMNEKQICIELNENTNVLEISKKNPTATQDADELLLISKKILVHQLDLPGKILKNIAQIIIDDFIHQEDMTLHDIIIHYNEQRRQIIENDNVFNVYMTSHQSVENDGREKRYSYNFLQTINLYGTDNIGSQLVGFDCINQVFTDFGFIGGICDEKFTLLKLDRTYNVEKQQNICNFVSKMSDLFQFCDSSDSPFNSENYFDLICVKSTQKNILIFDMLGENSTSNGEEIISDVRVDSVSNMIQQQYLESHTLNFMLSCSDNNQKIKIYHILKRKTQFDRSINKKHCFQTLLPKINSNSFFYLFEVRKSNFFIVISRIFEVKSIDIDTSIIKKSLDYFGTTLRIMYCNIKFLNPYSTDLDFIILKNCEFKYKLNLYTSLFIIKAYDITISNSLYYQPIFIDDFLKILIKERKNNFSLTKRANSFHLIIMNSDIFFLNHIPTVYVYISLDKCNIISVEDNILFVINSLFPEKTNIDMKSSSIYDKFTSQLINETAFTSLKLICCVLPSFVRIQGIYNWIIIDNCISSFKIDAYFKKLQIIDNKDEFSITNLISKAIPTNSRNSFIYEKIELIIKYFAIECLSNISVFKIQLYNCSIKTFSNVKCRNLLIQDSKCSFQLKIGNAIKNYQDDNLNLLLMEDKYIILESI